MGKEFEGALADDLLLALDSLLLAPQPILTAEKIVDTWKTDLVIRAYKDRDTSGETLPAIASRLGISYIRAWGIVRAYKARNRAATGSTHPAHGKSKKTLKKTLKKTSKLKGK